VRALVAELIGTFALGGFAYQFVRREEATAA
jgi:hypothetical protein